MADPIPPNGYLAPGERWPEGKFLDDHDDRGALEAAKVVAAVARTIAYKRNFRTWTQIDLADRAGVSRFTVSRVESGSSWVDLKPLLRICNALDLRVQVSPPPPELGG